MAFEFLKDKKSEETYGSLVGRLVVYLLRHLNDTATAMDEIDEIRETSESSGGSNVEAQSQFDGDDSDDEEMFASQGEVFALANLLGDDDDDESDIGDDDDDSNIGGNDNLDDERDDYVDDPATSSGLPDISDSDSSSEQVAYPILRTKELTDALRSLDCGLRSDASQIALLHMFHNVSVALCTTQPSEPEKHRFRHPIEAFILASSLKRDGAFKKPVSIAPNLTVLQYWIQFVILRDAVNSQEDTSM